MSGFQWGVTVARRSQLGFPGVEKGADSVVREVGSPKRCSFDPFDEVDEVVEGFGGICWLPRVMCQLVIWGSSGRWCDPAC